MLRKRGRFPSLNLNERQGGEPHPFANEINQFLVAGPDLLNTKVTDLLLACTADDRPCDLQIGAFLVEFLQCHHLLLGVCVAGCLHALGWLVHFIYSLPLCALVFGVCVAGG